MIITYSQHPDISRNLPDGMCTSIAMLLVHCKQCRDAICNRRQSAVSVVGLVASMEGVRLETLDGVKELPAAWNNAAPFALLIQDKLMLASGVVEDYTPHYVADVDFITGNEVFSFQQIADLLNGKTITYDTTAQDAARNLDS